VQGVAASRRRRAIQPKERLLRFVIVHPFEFVVLADGPRSRDGRSSIDRLQETLQMGGCRQRTCFTLPHARRAIKPPPADMSAMAWRSP
jgi:hypothetical protein